MKNHRVESRYLSAIFAVVLKEISDALRNRWLLAITLFFAVFSTGIAWLGAAASGSVGFTSIDSTMVSLASLCMFVIPLIALFLAYGAIVAEDEDGTLLLLLTYPISRGQLLMGKFIGHGSILAGATMVGFGSSGVMAYVLVDGLDGFEALRAWGLFIASATALGLAFIAMAYLISAMVQEKSKAAGLALVIWIFYVLIFDLGLLGLLVGTQGHFYPDIFPYFLLLNPADIFRLINMAGLPAGNGVLSLTQQSPFSILVLFSGLSGWIGVPLLAAYWRFTKRPL